MQVYIVEDSPTQALAVKRLLKQVPDAEVSIFSDGLVAYRAITQLPPDLLLMDLILPSLHGLALCRLLKFHREYAKIPVLVFSSITEHDIAQQVAAAGANEFLRKPFQGEELLQAVGRLTAPRTDLPVSG